MARWRERALGELATVALEEGERTLDQLESGEAGLILDVDASLPLGRRLLDMGIAPGALARVLRRAPLGDPMEISLPDTLVSLRSYEAALVKVRLG